jgi:4'-phosphopantetheinyl transferase
MSKGVEVSVVLIAIRERAAARSALVELLAKRLGCAADDVPLVEGEGGKPSLEPGSRLPDLRFNLSHSGDRAVVAVAEGVEVGVDIERITPRRGRDYLADWTRREAYAKGVGHGLAGGVRQLEFRPCGDGGWSVIDAGLDVPDWRVLDLELGEALVGALAADSEVDVSLRLDLAGR